MQLGSVVYNFQSSLGANGAAIANNGLSLNLAGTTIQLGGPAGAASAAQLLNNREIPMAGFNMTVSGMGSTAQAGSSLWIWKADATKSAAAPWMQWQSSAGAGICNLIIPDANAVYLGGNIATSNGGGAGQRSVGIGTNVLAGCPTPFELVAIGFNALTSNSSNGIQIVAIGSGSMQIATNTPGCTFVGTNTAQSLTTGPRNNGFGLSVLINCATGADNAGFGNGTLAESVSGTSNFSQNTALGNSCAQQQTGGNNNFFGGFQNMFNLGWGTGNVTIGAVSFNNGGSIVNNNTLIGSGQQITAAGTMGSGNNWFGQGITSTTAALANNTTIGTGITANLNNVAVFGRADQDILLGITAPTIDNGSRVQIFGGISLPLRSTAANTNLAFVSDHTLILTAGGLTIGLPALAAGANGIFCIVNQSTASTTGTNYVNKSGASVNTIAANSALWLQANGAANYQQIN